MAGVRAEVARPGSGHVCGASVRVACVRRVGGLLRSALETGPRRRLAVETGGEGDAAPRGRVRRRAGDPFKFQASSPATATSSLAALQQE